MADQKESTGDLPINITADFTEMLNASPKGIKYVFNILFGKRHAEAERRIRLSNAQDYADIKKIVSGEFIYDSNANTLTENTLTENQIKDINHLIAQAIQSEEVSNIISCLKPAIPLINDSESDNIADVSQDFINRWRNEAKLIGEEEFQYIWGRILAEEINAPNTISTRTLDVIKNLSRQEAEYFTELSDFIFFDSHLIDSASREKPLYSSDKATALRDAGLLVSFTPGFYRSSTWPTRSLTIEDKQFDKIYYIVSNDKFFFVDADEISKEPSVSMWELTKSAIDLYRVIRKEKKTEENSVKKIIDMIREKEPLSKIYYSDIEQSGDNTKTIVNLKISSIDCD